MDKPYLSEVYCVTKTRRLQDFQDWMTWYTKVIPFDHIVIYDNESFVDIKSVCEQYGGLVEYYRVDGFPERYKINTHHSNQRSRAKWTIPLDDDEFLYIGEQFDHSVNKFLTYMEETYPTCKKIAAMWINMISEHPVESRDDSTPALVETNLFHSRRAFNRATPYRARRMEGWIKCFVDASCGNWVYNIYNGHTYNQGHNPTFFEGTDVMAYFVNGEKSLQSCIPMRLPDDQAFVGHYSLRSRQEWLYKCSIPCSGVITQNLKSLSNLYDDVYKSDKLFEKLTVLKDLWTEKTK